MSVYTGFANAPRVGGLPGGGAAGDTLTLDYNRIPVWAPSMLSVPGGVLPANPYSGFGLAMRSGIEIPGGGAPGDTLILNSNLKPQWSSFAAPGALLPSRPYTGVGMASRYTSLPGGGAAGDVLSLDANLMLVWGTAPSGVGSSVAVVDNVATADGLYSWPVNSPGGDFVAGTGTVEVIDNIAFLTVGANTVDWPVGGVPEDDGPGPFSLTVSNGIGSFTPDSGTYSMPVDS